MWPGHSAEGPLAHAFQRISIVFLDLYTFEYDCQKVDESDILENLKIACGENG